MHKALHWALYHVWSQKHIWIMFVNVITIETMHISYKTVNPYKI